MYDAQILENEKAAIDSRLDALLANDDLTDAQRDEHDRLVREREGVVRELRFARAGRNRKTSPDPPSYGGGNRAVGGRGFSQPWGGRSVGAYHGETHGFRHAGEFLRCVMSAGIDPGDVDDRLIPLRQTTAGSDEARGISDPYGGFLVPEAFAPTPLMVTPEDDPTAAYTRKISMPAPVLKIPARTDKDHTTSVSGGLSVTRKVETGAATSSQMTLERVTLSATTLLGLAYSSEELIQDAPGVFTQLLAASFKQEMTNRFFREKISGTGVGEPEGVLKSPALVTVGLPAGQPAKTVVLENILAMRSRCWGYSKAIWLVNHDVAPQLGVLNQQVGTGGSGLIWQPSFIPDRPDMLCGRPIHFTEYASTLGTLGDVLLCNWEEFLEGTYQPMQSAESIHVRFVNHERAFKFWIRNDARGWWRSALTPVNSTATMSPFVVLQAR